jgi:hypothetical protein
MGESPPPPAPPMPPPQPEDKDSASSYLISFGEQRKIQKSLIPMLNLFYKTTTNFLMILQNLKNYMNT